MSRKLIIFGGLPDEPSIETLISKLRTHVSSDVDWFWVRSTVADGYRPNHKSMNRHADELGKWQKAKKREQEGGPPPTPERLEVLLLFALHGQSKNTIFNLWPDPTLIPANVDSLDKLADWLQSPEAHLFPRLEWWAGVQEAALVAMLCKLLSKKKWNSSMHGHAWAKEEHLLNESPVVRDDRPTVVIEARRMISTLEGKLLLSKGAAQGNTPKEWSINSKFLPQIKSAILAHSLAGLRTICDLDGLFERIENEAPKAFRLDIEIVSEKVRFECRQRSER